MKNFDWTSFTRKIAVRSNLTDIYNAWAVPAELEKWFLSKAIYTKPSGALVDNKKCYQENDTYQWSWHLFDIVEEGKVIKANGKDLIHFTFAGDCIVEIKLTQQGDYQIPTDDESKKEIRLGCDAGWSFYLVNLKSIYEGGLDLRNKVEDHKGMLNS